MQGNTQTGVVQIMSCNKRQNQAWLVSGTGLENATIRAGYAQSKCLSHNPSTDVVYLVACEGTRTQAWLLS
ncbi:ricin-type beta-trefoil lectin domain protein [Embleya scabrispora]|uniref:ricin-type beta-trefoil lectin domain protein n=1 Tax=Embleya scabrispora TaxID=159449 RepID=UPI002285C64F|nr:ricin-type beta-trefoil lectin domain protein [Embleya scabrispora]